MSTYVVDSETINRVVTWIDREITNNRHTPLKRVAAEHSIQLDGPQWQQDLAVAMYQWNWAAVLGHYNEQEIEDMSDITYVPRLAQRVQVLKALMTWIHQCNEGAIPQGTLYQFCKRVAEILALSIVIESAEYRHSA